MKGKGVATLSLTALALKVANLLAGSASGMQGSGTSAKEMY